MTSASIAAYLRRILDADDVRALIALAAETRRAHPGDEGAKTVAREAALEARRLSTDC